MPKLFTNATGPLADDNFAPQIFHLLEQYPSSLAPSKFFL